MEMLLSFSKDTIVNAARNWIGTPYHHQAAKQGVGADCLGLLRGVYREVIGRDPYQDNPVSYSDSWAEGDGGDTLLEAAQKYLEPIEIWGAGDVLLFRIKNANYLKHCAIVVSENSIVHSVSNVGVIESSLAGWSKRIGASFSFPEAI